MGRITELITEVMVLPSGMQKDHPEARTFALFVRWRGPFIDGGRGGYAVTSASDKQMSKNGKWRWKPEPFLQHHFRWEHIDDAVIAARRAVETYTVMGRTWAEFQKLERLLAEQEARGT